MNVQCAVRERGVGDERFTQGWLWKGVVMGTVSLKSIWLIEFNYWAANELVSSFTEFNLYSKSVRYWLRALLFWNYFKYCVVIYVLCYAIQPFIKILQLMIIVGNTNNEDEAVARSSSGWASDYNITVLIADLLLIHLHHLIHWSTFWFYVKAVGFKGNKLVLATHDYTLCILDKNLGLESQRQDTFPFKVFNIPTIMLFIRLFFKIVVCFSSNHIIHFLFLLDY